MSLLLSNQNLAAAVVGTTGTVDLSAANAETAYSDKPAHARLYNESGCGLQVNVGQRGIDVVPAGGWMELEIQKSDGQITWTVLYILPNAPVTRLISIFYKPEEDPPPLILGNSPIGLANSVAVNQVINDGNPTPTIVVEATPSGGSSSLKFLNDGSGYFSGDKITCDAAGNLVVGERLTAGDPADPSGTDTATNPAALLNSFFSSLAIYCNPVDGNWSFVPKASGAARGMALYGVDSGGSLHVGLIVGNNGAITDVAGQGTAGNLGVPMIVAQALEVSVAVTTLQTILTFAIPVAGFYRLNPSLNIGNGSSCQPSFFFSTGGAPHAGGNFTFQTGTTAQGLSGSGPTFAAGLGQVPLLPATAHFDAGTTLTVKYQDATGTPNDTMSVIVERLA